MRFHYQDIRGSECMRRRYIQRNGKLVEVMPQSRKSHEIMPDIKPYKSMVTGEMITSRSRHRQHLKDHGCIEVGNDTAPILNQYEKIPDKLSASRKEIIRQQIMDMPYKEFKAMLRRDVQRVRDNGG